MKKTNLLYRSIHYFRQHGAKATLVRAMRGGKIHSPHGKTDVIGQFRFIVDKQPIPFNRKEYEKQKNAEKKIINWVIPEMGPGSGGHTTIFRFVSNLERLGYHNRIYLFLSPAFQDNASIRSFLKEHFPLLIPEVEVFCDVSQMKFAHATIATSWITAYYVQRFQNTISKFYFIQDYEPYFYAHGSEYEFAENTYKMGFRGITAGDWLRDVVREKFGMEAESFRFSYDRSIYKPHEKTDGKKRVFFYARPVTPRRDFELGILAIDELCKKIPDLEVIFAGWDVSNYEIPFRHENLGTVTPEVLAEAYAKSDMCLVISNTNLSLVPLEVMACNSVAVCSKGENSTWLVNDENAILVEYDPVQIAETMAYYFKHPQELNKLRKAGMEFAKTTSWEKEAEKVYDYIKKGIEIDEGKISE